MSKRKKYDLQSALTSNHENFDELLFFAIIKYAPGLFLGEKNFMSLRDMLSGMSYAFVICGQQDKIKYFNGFSEWYNNKYLYHHDAEEEWQKTAVNDYECWWSHIFYTGMSLHQAAFDNFFHEFEMYLDEVHKVHLPVIEKRNIHLPEIE